MNFPEHMKTTHFLAITILTFTPSTLSAQGTKAERDAADAALHALSAADTTGKLWTTGGVFNVNFTQVNLTNWAAGGFNSVGGVALFNGFANKHKGRIIWDNSAALAFGGVSQDGSDPIKTDDRIELNTKWGYELKKPWFAAAIAQFKTQFTEGFDGASGARISNVMSPAYFTIGAGFDYRPNDHFSAFLSPAAAKITFVNDQNMADAGAYGVDPAVYDLNTAQLVSRGKTTRFEFGAYARAQYTTTLCKNVTFLTRGDLYSNYLKNPQNIDVNWETLWTFKINDWFAATMNTLLIYDDDVTLIKTGGHVPGPGTQFKESLGIGLTWKI